MLSRPTVEWNRKVQEDVSRLTAGTLARDDAFALDLWPEAFIAAVDTALDAFEENVRRLCEIREVKQQDDALALPGMPSLPPTLPSPSDRRVIASVKRVVLALNAVNEEHGNIETGEREELCAYIEQVLTAAGVDLDALARRRDISRHELTGQWRAW